MILGFICRVCNSDNSLFSIEHHTLYVHEVFFNQLKSCYVCCYNLLGNSSTFFETQMHRIILVSDRNINATINGFLRQRPYHIEHTSSRPITEVKQC